ncbi:ShlB/FhaC/HecB family hemolysin secretion/activation protein [Ralstonia solanacearum]|uniref:ShlB/FhaC/HecB family hemolysin secretion/activation protein n=1 Tax=Ralstonia solanacearum TaxID=305 RepID=A0AAW5ZRI7_RALSL|nr:ShlB/FhaC/HecB family hemolysin secretion/activation protein [Ralstonia solanacearum]MDB0572598.1 ShlB/FhaC/HecB family hemolysin secretion/activation protein [Ralstonia solanacearum]
MGRGSSVCRLGGGKRLVLLGACVLPMSVALAQTAPAGEAAQELLRQQERERLLRQQQEPKPDVRLERGGAVETDRLPASESPCFRIDRITLTGDAAARFQWALSAADPSDDPATGRCLGAAGINLVMKRVQNAIVARGYVTTRVLAAPQDLKQGTLGLTLVPGRIRAIRFSEDSSPRATKWNALPAAPGDILNLRDIEQGLENFKRVPTADADIQIAPAEGPDAAPGESDLVIVWKQGLPFRLNVAADDSGSKYTGKYQGSVTVSYDHWWTLNDLFYASFNHDLGGGYSGSKGTRGYTVHYEVPYDYWLLGFTTSSYDYYQSVVGANQTYIYSGTSENSEVRLSRLFYRDAVRKTSAYVRGWVRSSANFIDDTEIEVQRRRTAGWEIGLNHREFIGAATLDANVAYRKGTGMLSSLPAPEEAFEEGTSRPSLITVDAQLSVPFAVASQRLRYTTAWRGQWNRTPLVPQDRFSIGGRYTVRGFDGENTLIGDRGWLVRNDLGWALGNSGQELYAGVDYGEVGGQSTRLLIGQHLAGAVLGLRGGYKGLFWDVFVGTPLSKPEGFRTSHTTAGFNVSWSY